MCAACLRAVGEVDCDVVVGDLADFVDGLVPLRSGDSLAIATSFTYWRLLLPEHPDPTT
jgi:hypothetical protein